MIEGVGGCLALGLPKNYDDTDCDDYDECIGYYETENDQMVTDDNGPVVMRHKTQPKLKLTLFCRKAIPKMSFVSSHFFM